VGWCRDCFDEPTSEISFSPSTNCISVNFHFELSIGRKLIVRLLVIVLKLRDGWGACGAQARNNFLGRITITCQLHLDVLIVAWHEFDSIAR
jgi:hypothetical protein